MRFHPHLSVVLRLQALCEIASLRLSVVAATNTQGVKKDESYKCESLNGYCYCYYLAKITGIIIDLTETFMTIAYMPTQHILSINFCQNNWQIKK